MAGFVFFDVETTGLKVGFDQIVQFAAVLTDNDLNIVDTFEERSRLMPHVIPDPEALLTNGLSIEHLTDPQLQSHYAMVWKIRAQLLAWSPAIFLGYNSIGFDEKMLQQALFQTLHDPYLTSKHGNSRTDVLRLALAGWAATPSCLAVPTGANGRPSFKLQLLAAANGIEHDRAHDAMADVKATVLLCRRVRDEAPEVWNRFVRFSNKKVVVDFVGSAEAFWLAEFFANEAFHSPVVCIGNGSDNNLRLCFNLECDPAELAQLTDEALAERLQAKSSPIRQVRVNAAPAIGPLFEAPDAVFSIELDLADERAERLLGDRELVARLATAYYAGRPPWPVSPYAEGRMISGSFPDYADQERMAEFHQAGWDERAALAERFDDERLRALGRRLVYFGSRSVLDDAIRSGVERELAERLLLSDEDKRVPLGVPAALAKTERLRKEQESEILDGYSRYLQGRLDKLSAFASMS